MLETPCLLSHTSLRPISGSVIHTSVTVIHTSVTYPESNHFLHLRCYPLVQAPIFSYPDPDQILHSPTAPQLVSLLLPCPSLI